MTLNQIFPDQTLHLEKVLLQMSKFPGICTVVSAFYCIIAINTQEYWVQFSCQTFHELNVGEQGRRVRGLAPHQCVTSLIPRSGIICGLSLLLILYSAPRGFSPGSPVFPSLQKPTLQNSHNKSLEYTGFSEQVHLNSLVLCE